MPAFFRSHSSHFAAIHNRFGRCRYGIAVLWLLLLACGVAAAQNTNNCQPTVPNATCISGTVYDPRGATGLPLPNVLVYASTTPVAPPASGAQCLTFANQTPTGAISYAYTGYDGTFTLQNVPEGASYTIVIQAGKWQSQFPNIDGTGPLTGPLSGLVLSMPANHTLGNIPYIAIVTGSVDGAECVLRDMGISDSEFTDDNQSVNPGGRIHLYEGSTGGSINGSAAGGAVINSSTPPESSLTGSSATLNGYDMVMFPCKGGSQAESPAAMDNIVSFTNTGGRIFTTHYSYEWLDSDSPYGSKFLSSANAGVADWNLSRASLAEGDIYPATVQTNFFDGGVMAQWLKDISAALPGTGAQTEVGIGTVRVDVGSVIAPTQSWVTLNNGTYPNSNPPPVTVTVANNPVMQMTFNAPVGAAASSQCGRVMFNDYHVIDLKNDKATGKMFPAECPSEPRMSTQEEMLEYALFDLSGFVQPVVVPTVSVTFAPSPLTVKSGDTADQLTVNVNSGTNETDSSAVLSFTLPSQLTVTAMSDPTGGWICTVSTATCTRTTSLLANTTDSVTLTLSVALYTTLASYTGTITATVSSVTFYTNYTSPPEPVIFQQVPTITWATPANIIYGTPLSATQLDASSTLPGTFTYSPAAGTILATGTQTLNTTFMPTDKIDYTTATASVTLTVVPGTPTITITSSVNPIFMTYAVSFTASLPSYASSETGTVTFYSGSTAIGTASVSGGSATLTTTSLAAGSQSITAVYSGDADYGPATSSAISETVQDFTLAFAGGNGTVTAQPGGQATYSLVVTPVNGVLLPAAVTLSASNLPLGMTAGFSPATITAGSAATTVTMTITLPGKSANELPRSPFGGDALPVALGLILLPLVRRMRKARARLTRLVVLLAIGAALAVGFMGCGAKTAPQSFLFSVTAASGTLSHSLTPGLTVE